jgi:hypothetical protein
MLGHRPIMEGVSRPSPVHQEHRVRAPVPPPADRLRDAYFADVRALTLGLVRGERWRLAVGPVTLLAFGEPTFDGAGWTWPITGGLLARGPGGSLRYAWQDGQLVGVVDGYRPLLPRPLFRLGQVPVHRWVTRRFLLGLRGRTPAPGVPAGPAQRLLAASLDVAACAALAALLPRRRLAAFAALLPAYHLAWWALGGRTPGGWLAGQRLVSVDGGRPAPWQAAVRLAALPLAAATLRAAHDEAAGTEVIEA